MRSQQLPLPLAPPLAGILFDLKSFEAATLGRWHADAPAALFVIRGSAQEAGQRLDGDQAGGGSGAIFTASPAWATTVISPPFRSFRLRYADFGL